MASFSTVTAAEILSQAVSGEPPGVKRSPQTHKAKGGSTKALTFPTNLDCGKTLSLYMIMN